VQRDPVLLGLDVGAGDRVHDPTPVRREIGRDHEPQLEDVIETERRRVVASGHPLPPP